MTISAKVIAHSVGPAGIPIVSMELRYPRFIHAEVMTHRVFSRNASSSRAIPVERLIKDIQSDPAMPIHWGKNRPGMQAKEELSGQDLVDAKEIWLEAMEAAVASALNMHKAGAHKQIVNRILEPFAHINVILTATDMANFYGLRRHEDAQPEIRALADAMYEAQQAFKPTPLSFGQWHMPYVSARYVGGEFAGYTAFFKEGERFLTTDEAQMVSTARCARVSYKTHDGEFPTFEKDMALYEQLVVSQPLHASPAEHQATPDWAVGHNSDGSPIWARPELHGNLRGWRQHRKFLPNENIQEYAA